MSKQSPPRRQPPEGLIDVELLDPDGPPSKARFQAINALIGDGPPAPGETRSITLAPEKAGLYTEARIHGDGWCEFDGVLDGFTVAVLLTFDTNGAPRCGGLQIKPVMVGSLLSTSRWRDTLPIDALVRLAASAWKGASGLLMPVPTPRPRGGSLEHSQAVADMWRWGQAMGIGGTKAVQDAWGMSRLRAEQWVREARAKELLEPWRTGGGQA